MGFLSNLLQKVKNTGQMVNQDLIQPNVNFVKKEIPTVRQVFQRSLPTATNFQNQIVRPVTNFAINSPKLNFVDRAAQTPGVQGLNKVGQFGYNTIAKPVIDYGKGVDYAFGPTRLANLIMSNSKNPVYSQYGQNQLLNDKPAPVTPKQMIANTVQTMLTVAPLKGANLGSKELAGLSKLTPDVVQGAKYANAAKMAKYGEVGLNTAKNAAVGAGFMGSQAYGENKSPKEIAKSAVEGALFTGGLSLGAEGLNAGISKIANKINLARAEAWTKPAQRKINTEAVNFAKDQLKISVPNYQSLSADATNLDNSAKNALSRGDMNAATQLQEAANKVRDRALEIKQEINTHTNTLRYFNQPQFGERKGAMKNPFMGDTPDIPNKPSQPTGAGNVGGEVKQAERGFVTSVKKSNEVSPEVQKMVSGTYTKGTNAEKIAQSGNVVKNIEQATTKALSDISQTAGRMTPQQISDAIVTAKSHDALGTQAGHEMANTIYNGLARHATGKAQGLQAFSLLSNRTPEALKYSAVKTLEGNGVKVEGNLAKNLENLMGEVRNSTANSDARNIATQKLVKFVNDKLPRNAYEAGVGLWRAGLLTGPETLAKVGISHVITTPIELASRPVSAGVDKLTSLVTGKRSISANPSDLGTFFEGELRGIKAMGTKIKSGIDLPNTGGFEQTMGAGTHETPYEKFVMNMHGVLPKGNYSGAYDMNIAEQARTEGMNLGKTGNDLKQYVSDMIKNPSQKIKDTATLEAEKFTNMNKTISGSMINKVQSVPYVGKFLAPFARIPGAIAEKGIIDYTPLGVGKAGLEVLKGIKSGAFDQRAFSEAIGKSITGTTMAAATGFALMNAGRMTLAAPSDTKERALWDTQGKQPNSILVGGHVDSNGIAHGGKWISLNAFGPAGISVGLGGAFKQAFQQGKNFTGAVVQSTAAAGKLVADQPYLKGLAGAANALNDPTRYAQTFMNNTVGSIIPALSSQIASGTDTLKRDYANNITDTLKSKIPFLRQQLTPQRDVFGGTLPGANPNGTILGGVLGTVNPFYPSSPRNTNDPATNELQRLYNINGTDTTAIPSKLTPSQTLISGTQKVKLNQQQLDTLEQSGQAIQQQMNQLIQTPSYQQATDDAKQKALTKIIDDTRTQAKMNLATGNNSGTGVIDMSKISSSAQQTIDKANFENSGKNFDTINGNVYRKNSAGNTTVQTQDAFNSQLYSAQLTSYAKNKDLNNWMNTANLQMNALQNQLKDPNVDQLDKVTIQNKIDTLTSEAQKYNSYGGFTKPKAAKKASTAKKTAAITALKNFKVKEYAKPTMPTRGKISGVKTITAQELSRGR